MRARVTWLSNELIRSGAHAGALGSDGFVLMAYLLSCAGGKTWETSAVEISEKFGWGRNRERATRALDSAVKDNRLIVREYRRDGQIVPFRCAYVVCAGGRRFTDEELFIWSAPIELEAKPRGGAR